MKKATKYVALIMVCLMMFSLAACSAGKEKPSSAPNNSASAGTEKGDSGDLVFGFASKTTADPMFIGTYDGFKEVCDDMGIESIYRGTDNASAEAEIEIINQFIAQGVDGIAVIAADYDALEAVLQQAMDVGIPVVSVDSATNPASRDLHLDCVNNVDLGRKMFQSAAKICDYKGQITVVSGDPRVAIFADFEEGIRAEYADNTDGQYDDIELIEEFYYGYDLPDQSTQEANAMFKNYPDVDVVICPTTVSILSTAKIIQDNDMDAKVTGIGLPSEMVTYFDNGICPEMWLWDVYDYGNLTAHALKEMVDGKLTGSVGETFEAGELGTMTVIEHEDGGTTVVMSDGLFFDSSNIHEWADLL